MSIWTEDDLRKTAGTDDLNISPFREDGITYGTPYVDLVRRSRRRSLRARVQRTKLALVPGGS